MAHDDDDDDAPFGPGRTFAALRKAGRRERARAPVYHAVTPHCRIALCCSEPGAGSGWAEPPGPGVTCPGCRRRLDRLARDGAAVVVIGRAAPPPWP
jgi:hypothetical protein